MVRPLRILLADDNERIRGHLKGLLAAEDGWEVVAEVTDGREAVSRSLALRPDVILMDISMPDLNGVDATSQIVREWPEAKVLILSMYEGEDTSNRVSRSGARGRVLKSRAVQDLVNAIKAAVSERSTSRASAD